MLVRRLRALQVPLRGWAPVCGNEFSTCQRGQRPAKRKDGSSSSNNDERTTVAGPKPPSLFEELFPEMARATETPRTKSAAMAAVTDDSLAPWLADAPPPRTSPPPPSSRAPTSTMRASATVLILASTTATLAPSDFYRIAPQGQHVEGWTGGLLKVLQARDTATLEPRGRYTLLFDSAAAAQAYADRIRRLPHEHHRFST